MFDGRAAYSHDCVLYLMAELLIAMIVCNVDGRAAYSQDCVLCLMA